MYISFILKDWTFALITAFGYHKKVFCKTFVGSNDKFFSISLNWNTLPSCLAYLTYRFDNHCILLFRNQNQLKVAQRLIQQQVFLGRMIIHLKKTQEQLRKHSIDNLMAIYRYVLFHTKVLQSTMFNCLSP